MADLISYLDWRGDVPFSVDPFNEVDNIILAQISYTDFEGVMTQDEELPIERVSELYFSLHTEAEVEARTTFFRLAPILMKRAAECERYRGITLSRYLNIISTDREEQCSIITFRLQDGTYYIAFRGTDGTMVGWKEDFNLAFMNETASQKRAVEYVNKYFAGTDSKLYFGGHSKGGNLAVYSAAFCEPDIRDRIIRIYSNDSPGFRKEITESEEYRRIVDKVSSYIPEESIVGVLFNNTFESKVIKSSAKGINQHDPMRWQVIRNHFEYAESRSIGSEMVDRTMTEWLADIPDENRKDFIDSLFSSISSAGINTVSDVSVNGFKKLSDFLKSIKEMNPDKQQEFISIVKSLIRTGSGVFREDMKGTIPKTRKEQKKEARAELLERRKGMKEEEVKNLSKIICRKIEALSIFQEADVILAYMSKGNEVDVRPLIRAAMKHKKKVYIPKVISKTQMEFFRYTGRLRYGNYRIKEPAVATEKVRFAGEKPSTRREKRVLILVPMVGFDDKRNRIGHGGGYYDRYLKTLRKDAVTIGVAYELQKMDSLPVNRYDKKPYMIVTEENIYT